MSQGCPGLFDGLSSLVDVGGGNGTTIKLLVKACPWLQGINFDLPHVVSVAAEISGVEHVGGDMFESVPKADAAFILVSHANEMLPWVYRSFIFLGSHLRRPAVRLAETHIKGFVKGLQVVSTFKSFIYLRNICH